MAELCFWTVFWGCVLLATTAVGQRPDSTCPVSSTEAARQAQVCLYKTNHALSLSAGITTYWDLKQGCESGSFVATIQCLEDLIRSCEGVDQAIYDSLRLRHNVDSLSTAVRRVCGNLDEISASHCSSHRFMDHKVCMRNEVAVFQKNVMKHAKIKEGLSERMRKITCQYYNSILSSCVETSLRKAMCGDVVSSLFIAIPRSTLPPLCDAANISPQNTSSQTKQTKQRETTIPPYVTIKLGFKSQVQKASSSQGSTGTSRYLISVLSGTIMFILSIIVYV